jgi:hypothetical protein
MSRPICISCNKQHLHDTPKCIHCRQKEQEIARESKRQAFELDEEVLLQYAVQKVDKTDVTQYTGLNEAERFLLVSDIKAGNHKVHRQVVYEMYCLWTPNPMIDLTFYKLMSRALGQKTRNIYNLELNPFLKGLSEGTLHLKGNTIYYGQEGTAPKKRQRWGFSKKERKPSSGGAW